MRQKELSLGELKKLLVYWQKRLGLSNWTVTLKLTNDPEFETRGNCVISNFPYREAIVTIATHFSLGNAQSDIYYDQEITLVHELEHIHHWPLDEGIEDGSAEDDYLETMIEMNARALVRLKREMLAATGQL